MFAVLIGAAAILYVMFGSIFKPADRGDFHTLAVGSLSKLQTTDPAPYPSTLFLDADGKPVRLSAFKGHPVILNLWATWCAPCVKEMPTLAALQATYASKGLKVIAVSMDQSAQTDAAKAFMAKQAPLGFYQDAKYGFLSDIKPHLQGFPTTVLFDKDGIERAVLAGDADWSSPEAKAVVNKLLSL